MSANNYILITEHSCQCKTLTCNSQQITSKRRHALVLWHRCKTTTTCL